jgi:hypothetical protein
MVTPRRKLRDRKQLYLKIYILIALFVAVIGGAYLLSLKLFVRDTYISPLAKIASNDFAHQDDRDIEFIRESLAHQKIEINSLKREGSSYVLILKDESQVILSAEKDISSQISSLQFILSRLTMEGKLFTQLDLRFDNPVIKLRK